MKIALKIVLMIILVVIIAGSVMFFFTKQKQEKNEATIEDILSGAESIEANLTEYIVYGTHLNVKGTLTNKISEIQNIKLILEGVNAERQEIALEYQENQTGFSFYTSELINTGIDLETISIRTICINVRSRIQRRFPKCNVKKICYKKYNRI